MFCFVLHWLLFGLLWKYQPLGQQYWFPQGNTSCWVLPAARSPYLHHLPYLRPPLHRQDIGIYIYIYIHVVASDYSYSNLIQNAPAAALPPPVAASYSIIIPI